MEQVVWITGASSGIGRAAARVWAARGARVVVSARNREALVEVVNSFPAAARDRAHVEVLDLAEGATLPAAVERVLHVTGHVDLLVHCGGISQRSRAMDTGIDVDRRVMEVDYFGTVGLTKALLPHFVARQSGHFVVVTSLMGLFSSPLRSGYCAAKHALHGFFESLRAEHHADGIHVTLVCPGFIHTDISRNAVIGDGSRQGTLDDKTGKGLAPEVCAERIVRAVERKRPLVLIGKSEILGAYVHRFFPALFRRIIRRAAVT